MDEVGQLHRAFLRRARALWCAGMKYGEIEGKPLAYAKAGWRFSEFLKDKSAENRTKLAQSALGLAKIYDVLIAEYPILATLAICEPQELGAPRVAMLFRAYTAQIIPKSDREKVRATLIYPYTAEVGELMAESGAMVGKAIGYKDYTAERTSALLGCRTDFLNRHSDLLAQAVFLHEMGHAYDLLSNFVAPLLDELELMKLSGDERLRAEEALLVAAIGAFEEYGRAGHYRQMQCRLAKKAQLKTVELFAARMRGYGARGNDECAHVAESNSHHDYASELAADSFMLGFMRRHRDLFDGLAEELEAAKTQKLDNIGMWVHALYGGRVFESVLEGKKFCLDEALRLGEKPVFCSGMDFKETQGRRPRLAVNACEVAVLDNPASGLADFEYSIYLGDRDGCISFRPLVERVPEIEMSEAEFLTWSHLENGDECYLLVIADLGALAIEGEMLAHEASADTMTNKMLRAQVWLLGDRLKFVVEGSDVELEQPTGFRRCWNDLYFDALMPDVASEDAAGTGRRMSFELLKPEKL